jgi:multidrug efflux pump subunit AcrA (membrane-fusion protein)
MQYDMREGTSEPLDLQITVTPTQSSEGVTPSLDIQTGRRTVPVPTPTVAWLSQPNWTVRVSGLGTLPPGTYRMRVKLTDGAGIVAYAPTGPHADTIVVVAP